MESSLGVSEMRIRKYVADCIGIYFATNENGYNRMKDMIAELTNKNYDVKFSPQIHT